MARVKLDRIDLRILRDLQEEGRITNVELARRAGISPPPCLRRVRALEETGCILGYHADIDAEALGFGVTVFANVGLHSQAENDLSAFETLVKSWPEVRECHMLAGETDFPLISVPVRGAQCQRGEVGACGAHVEEQARGADHSGGSARAAVTGWRGCS